jgi:hypothetical protein
LDIFITNEESICGCPVIKFLITGKHARPALVLDFSSRPFSLSSLSETVVSAIVNTGYATQAALTAAFA